MTDSEKRTPWGRAVEAETPRSAWGRPLVEVRRNPWGREVAESDEPKPEAEPELTEVEKRAAELTKDLGVAYAGYEGVSESAAQQWAEDIARRHLDRTITEGGDQGDYLRLLESHARYIRGRRPAAEAKKAPKVTELRESVKITDKKG